MAPTPDRDGQDKKVCLGVVTGAHGVRGLVRVKPYTEMPEGVAAYGPVETKDGATSFAISLKGMAKDLVICKLEGVDDRDVAAALRGTELYVPRERLPRASGDEEGWYYADLIGLRAVGLDGRDYGRIAGVENFGAGDLLEIAPAEGGQTVLMGFTDENVPEVDIAGGRVVIDPPAGTFGDDAEAERGE
ncbi:16S rRNA processing protein RimM [Parvibaculum lavamentivorans DS-1]|uniref:Ribosome maturation factor RimM n=1 Tax=Parvibaculum lavamentivorans (strain DS-1 / DSM 13023 / NCIMB 13966) TaxID=402881 RepID=RIMM_PARL1|nr:ribosome maturation factor RimM [Parvibaculum lavamentivorans]A7HT07.1 RecName: Full=Ribosome maturation factor RimM [Parvibaculum lavamentivorans DS-1]ABS63040.1 16S rRNA processing protein RimM [Parvibaculum lavamentivorans DS-1]